MSLFPIFLKLDGRRVVVVGGGEIAEGKIPGLLAAGARVRVIAPEAKPQIAEWARQSQLDWWQREFAAGDLNDAALVIAATSLRHVNEAVYREAEARGVLCNAVDDPDRCHFYYGAIVQRGDLQIAISTNGKSPALAQRLRKELEVQFGPDYATWLEWLGAARDLLRESQTNDESRKTLLHDMASGPSFEKFVKEARRDPAGKGDA